MSGNTGDPPIRHLDRRSGLLQRGPIAVNAFPVFDGGKVLVSATKMKSLIYGDEQQ